MAQIDEPGAERTAEPLEREAHLLDIGNIEQVTTFISTAVLSGVTGSLAWEALKAQVRAFRKRFGAKKTRDLEQMIYKELQDVRRKSHLSNKDLQLRAEALVRQAFGEERD